MRITCYEFELSPGSHLRLNDTNVTVTFDGKTFIPALIKKSEIDFDRTKGENSLDVTLSRTYAASLLDYILYVAGGTVSCVVYEYDPDTATDTIMFSGIVSEFESTDQQVKLKIDSVLTRQEDMPLANILTPGCLLDVFDDRCTVIAGDWQVNGTIASISGSTVNITVVGRGSNVPIGTETGVFKYGKIKSGFEWRMITDNDSPITFVELNQPFSTKVTAGDSFVAYAGCDKKVDTCKIRYSNLVNFLGFPYAPFHDLTIIGRKPEVVSGGKGGK